MMFVLTDCVSLSVLQRLCLNGSTGQEVVVRKDLQNVEALTFDPISRLLYWVDAGAQKIEVHKTINNLYCLSVQLMVQYGLISIQYCSLCLFT